MDWSNERYVRLYVRDTLTWKRLRFEGQAIFCLLIRKVDRTGLIELDGAEPWEAAMIHTESPEAIARVGMQRLLDLKVLEHVGQNLIVPNFVEAQEASASPTMRQKEHRMRRRDMVRSGLDPSQRDTAIYFIQSEHGGEIKIGRADDVAQRLANLQTARPDKLVLLAAAGGTTEQERQLHSLFAAHRSKGEWFFPVEAITKLAAEVASRGSQAIVDRLMSQTVTRHETYAVTPSRAVPPVPSQAVPSVVSESTHTPTSAPSLVVRSEPLRAELPDNFPQRVSAAFQNAYMARYKLDPNMGGKSTFSFPSQLENTARMRSADPLELLAQCFERWTKQVAGNDRERKFKREFPYAAFVGAFGGLVRELGSPDDSWPGFELSAPVRTVSAAQRAFTAPPPPETTSTAEVDRQATALLAQLRTQGASK